MITCIIVPMTHDIDGGPTGTDTTRAKELRDLIREVAEIATIAETCIRHENPSDPEIAANVSVRVQALEERAAERVDNEDPVIAGAVREAFDAVFPAIEAIRRIVGLGGRGARDL